MEGRVALSCRLLLAAVAATVLAGCSHTPVAPAQNQTPEPAGLAVFNQALTLPAVAGSVVREADQVSYLVSQPAAGDKPPNLLARFNASCNEPNGKMMYPTGAGMAYFTAMPRSFDDDSQLPVAQRNQLHDSPQLRQACARNPRPDWRKLKGDADQQWLLLDAASVNQQHGKTLFWAAYDYPREQFDAQHTGVYVQRREHFAVDCNAHNFIRVSAFYIDADNGVGVGQVALDPKAHGLDAATADERLLLQAACAAPAQRAALPAQSARIKAPAKMPVPPVAAPVAEAVQGLAMPPAPLAIKRLELSFDATVLKRKIADNDKAQWFFSSDPSTGQMVIQKRGLSAESNIEVSFRGLIPLSVAMSNPTPQGPRTDLTALTYLKFEGDWQNLPVGQTVSYSRAYKPLLGAAPKASDVITLHCVVEAEQPASALNPLLTGTAKQLTCKGDNEHATGVGHYAYLSAYGMFFPQRTVDRISDWAWRIQSVE